MINITLSDGDKPFAIWNIKDRRNSPDDRESLLIYLSVSLSAEIARLEKVIEAVEEIVTTEVK